jgi:hypothetical protein
MASGKDFSPSGKSVRFRETKGETNMGTGNFGLLIED